MARKGLFTRLREGASRIFRGIFGRKEESQYPDYSSDLIEYNVDDSFYDDWYKQNTVRQLRENLQPIIDEANNRWAKIEDSDFISKAIAQAQVESGHDYFDISQLTEYEDIIAEVSRARRFINDDTSTLKGAELYTEEEKANRYKDMFGKKWTDFTGQAYSNEIDDDYAKVAFRVYRDIESVEANRLMQYGSDSAIAMIYSMVENSGNKDKYNQEAIDSIKQEMSNFLSEKIGEKSRHYEDAFDEDMDDM